MSGLYPLKFKPILKEKVWGGHKIKDLQILDVPESTYGEAWLLSGLEGDENVVVNGFLADNTISELIEVYMEELVGERLFEEFGTYFPLLYKIIDATDNLSVQVHPNEEAAQEMETLPKSEMWYMIDTEKDAEILLGFNQEMNRAKLEKVIRNNEILSVLDKIKVSAGDSFFIPSGSIHAIGKGILLAEIQQASDTTYRVWDWNREGKDRQLHIEEALNSIDYKAMAEEPARSNGQLNVSSTLFKTPHFYTDEMTLTKAIEKDYSELDSFVTLLCVKGAALIKTEDTTVDIKAGELVLIPASLSKIQIYPQDSVRLLETYIP